MSYAKQNFKPGDVLLASQLNAMDDQIALNEAASKDFITSAGEYAAAAATSAAAAETSAEAAEAAAGAASNSADAASDSEVAANNSATAAALSAQGAYASAAAADASETAAATSAQNAADSATAASSSATFAESSAAAARGSAQSAQSSELSAQDSKNKAKTSEVMANLASTNAETAKNGAVTAKEAAEAAKTAAESAQTAAAASQTSAANSATAAAASQTAAAASETSASNSAASASSSATSASGSATAAAASASAAAQSAQDAQDVLDSIPPDYTAMTEDVSSLRSALELSNDNQKEIFNAVWVVGGLTNGVIDSSTRHAVTRDILSFQDDTSVYFDPNMYQGVICLYNDDETYNAQFYIGAPYQFTFFAGQKFRISIRPFNSEPLNLTSVSRMVFIDTKSGINDKICRRINKQIIKNGEEAGFYGQFYLGNISGGILYPRVQTRVVSDIMSFGKNVTLNAKDGYRFVVAYYADGVYTGESAWSTTLVIPANQQVRFLFAKSPDGSVISDTEGFVENFYFDGSGVVTNRNPFQYAYMQNGRMKLSAHMGAHDGLEHSELLNNSLPSFVNTGKTKMWACESDLNETSDGHFVMMHDATVDATTNGTGRIADMTLAQIRELRLLYRDGTVSNLQVPTFEEYLYVCKQYGLIAFCELKTISDNSSIMDICDIVKSYSMEEQFMFITNRYMISPIRQYCDYPILVLLASISDTTTIEAIKSEKNIWVDADYSIVTQTFVYDMHNNGIPVAVYTLNDKTVADNMFALGVDAITTDALRETDWTL